MGITKRIPLIYITVLTLLCCPLLTAYSEEKLLAQIEESETTEIFEREKIQTLALIPFSTKSSLAETKPVEEVAKNERFLTVSLYDALTAEAQRIQITPLKESDTEYQRIRSELEIFYYKDIAVKTGKQLEVDAVMTGVISEYREREGGEYGIDSPASVAFTVIVLSTETGETLWESYFTETQKPLFENVYEVGKFFKRGGKWISADQLAVEGARKVVMDFNQYLLTGK